MFPDNVGRFIIDGVINGHDWYAGEAASYIPAELSLTLHLGNTTNFLISTDDALTSVYDACVVAGPELCAIYENSTDLIRARINRLLDSVHLDPIPAINDTDPTHISWAVLDYSTAVGLILTVLYSPYEDAQAFAEAVVALESGDTSVIFELVDSPLTNICPANASAPFDDGDFDAKTAIWFGDSLTDGNRTFAQAQANYQAAVNLSSFNTLWYPANQAPFT